jgi:endogenous inhibitor of DNA gyrase (YacG/DUF329 family)
MPKKRIRSLRCPTCRKIVLRGDPDFPFCSERCRLTDLGKWASGGYVVSTPVEDSDGLDQLETQQDGKDDDGKH